MTVNNTDTRAAGTARRRDVRVAVLYFAFASLWTLLSDRLLSLPTDDRSLLPGLSTFRGIAFVAVTTVLLYVLLRARRQFERTGDDATAAPGTRRLFAVCLVAVLAVPLIGLGVVWLHGPKVEKVAWADLDSIVELKAGQLESWLQERRSDADELALSISFLDSFERWRETGDPRARALFLDRLDILAQTHSDETELLDADGHRINGADDRPDTLDAIRQTLLPEALRSGKPQVSELYRDSTGRMRLDFLVPLTGGNTEPLRRGGFVVLRAPIEGLLATLFRSWPTASLSAEFVLVRRAGEELLVLNELRHRSGTALSYRLPLDALHLPAAIGARTPDGTVREIEGTDYRGTRVLASVRPIHGTSWLLVAKVDRDEVLAPLRDLVFWVSLVGSAGVIVIMFVVLLLWREQQRAHRLELTAHAAETDHLLKLFYDMPFVGMAITSPDSKRWLRVNDHLCEMLGYPREELLALTWPELTHPDDVAADIALLERMMAGDIDGYALEKRFVRKDGSVVAVDLDVKYVRTQVGAAGMVVAMLHDITRRRQADENLRIAAAAFESQEGMMVTDTAGVILRVNRAFTEITGFAEDEIIGKTPAVLRSGHHDAAFYRDLWSVLIREGQWQGEIWNRRKDGGVFPEWLSISAVKDGHGRATHYVGAFFDITERKKAEQRIRHLAFYDPLTHLPNRRLLNERLGRALAAARRSSRHGALLFIDLDHFQTVNDTLGHDVGDQLLVEAGRRFAACVREADTVARVGGDEFVAMCDDLDAGAIAAGSQAEAVAEKIREALATPFTLARKSGHPVDDLVITCSIGISLFDGTDESIDEPLKSADVAMSQAKNAGRNAIRFFEPAMQTALELRIATIGDLRRALPAGQLDLHYQKQVDAETRPVGAEALLRWNHPALGAIPPAEFIPLAEDTGLIIPIGQWVVDRACDRLAEWAASPNTMNLSLSVNLSGRQFSDHDMVDRFRRAFARSGIVPERLTLELTESAVLANINDSIVKMKALKALGVRLSIDDFGTGYSSLAYLKRLPIDELKIDQSFVRDLTVDPNDAAIVLAILGMARHFGHIVVAEGVETEAQFEFLRRNGCQRFQGYLFGRPMPAGEFESACLVAPACQD